MSIQTRFSAAAGLCKCSYHFTAQQLNIMMSFQCPQLNFQTQNKNLPLYIPITQTCMLRSHNALHW